MADQDKVTADEDLFGLGEEELVTAMLEALPATATTPATEAPVAPTLPAEPATHPITDAFAAVREEIGIREAMSKRMLEQAGQIHDQVVPLICDAHQAIVDIQASAETLAKEVGTRVAAMFTHQFTTLQQAEVELEQERIAFDQHKAAEQKKLDEQKEKCLALVGEKEASRKRWRLYSGFATGAVVLLSISIAVMAYTSWPSSHNEATQVTPPRAQSHVEQTTPPSKEQAVEQEEVTPPADEQKIEETPTPARQTRPNPWKK